MIGRSPHNLSTPQSHLKKYTSNNCAALSLSADITLNSRHSQMYDICHTPLTHFLDSQLYLSPLLCFKCHLSSHLLISHSSFSHLSPISSPCWPAASYNCQLNGFTSASLFTSFIHLSALLSSFSKLSHTFQFSGPLSKLYSYYISFSLIGDYTFLYKTLLFEEF